MSAPDRSSIVRRSGGILIAAWAFLVTGSVQPAIAENVFEALFGDAPFFGDAPRHGDPFHHGGSYRSGDAPRYVRPHPLPPRVSSYADPNSMSRREPRRRTSGSGVSSGSNGGSVAYCVRTCDGRYFPLQRHAGTSPAQMCRSLCPASKRVVFSGSKIDYAVAHNGMRYADLKTAFAYRDKVVEGCTCNGKDGLGLARLSTFADPTLRQGDIVATNEGFVSYRRSKSKVADFTPIDPSSGAWARRLSEIKIRPAPHTTELPPPPLSDEEAAKVVRKELRRAQLDR